MEPTLKKGVEIKVDTSAYKSAKPQRGDIIAFTYKEVTIISRVIGEPRDEVTNQGHWYAVNGKSVTHRPLEDQSEAKDGLAVFSEVVDGMSITILQDPNPFTQEDQRIFKLTPDEVWVLSDTRGGLDSRRIGPVPLKDVIGKVKL